MRDLSQLIDVDDPAWPLLRQELEASGVPTDLCPVDADQGRATLHQLQVTAKSYLGAFVLHCGGLVLDQGWLRVFGSPASGDPWGLPGLAHVNGFPPESDPTWRPGAGLVIAHDVLGGVFAVNGADPAEAGRPGSPGEVVYFAPDSLRWEALGAGHSAWLSWILSGALDQFYEALRWPGWREEVQALRGTEGMSLYPPLWSAEGRNGLAATSRRPVPMAELLGIARDASRQFDGDDPGFLGAV
ncbi:DUF2625 domain-containing protein [Streptomyces sp. VNUA116]|uniref:DUF2625 domain-containing protein n=1 Tax=Streptomyces sp. VNUA116 TaxID=3062449 RepID=UPI002675EDF3|nr:DUF2625 domain-containing protein [Streptomyces sp. VNUA116]WKU43037.1 DUF2625 domain-containing protein [Streptomyces sp. VNUA116]